MTHLVNGHAAGPPRGEWLPLWQLDDPARPPLPSPDQVREQRRRRRREALLLRLLAEHREALLPALIGLLAEHFEDLARRVLAEDLSGLLAELGKE
jgi:hypothetical protein